MSEKLKIIFAGTPRFSAVPLAALLEHEYRIAAVLTQPDRPAGRGRRLSASPVKELALVHRLPLLQPATLKDDETVAALAAFEADLMVVVAYGLILPPPVLALPRLGCINIHASLLPRWRGAAPIQRAILAGDRETGITIIQMDEGLDTGAMLHRLRCPIHDDDSAATLHDRLAALGARALLETLALLEQERLDPRPQDESLACYAAKISKEEAQLDWSLSANELERRVRAFNPWPVAYTFVDGERLRVWRAQVVALTDAAAPGSVVAAGREGITVATAVGGLRLLEVQAAGGRRMAVAEFLNAREIHPGLVLGGVADGSD
ncbi:MAG: methionyl-tRNA formyltransferase [Gammaproteobacteria bacterium]